MALRLLVGDAAVPHCHEVALVRTQPRAVSFPVLNGLDLTLQHLVAHVTVLVGTRDARRWRYYSSDRRGAGPEEHTNEDGIFADSFRRQ